MNLKTYINKVFKEKEDGQMLIFVLIVLLLLFIILISIVVNVKVDVKETQVEREYESGYTIAESELLTVAEGDYDDWVNDSSVQEVTPTMDAYEFCPNSSDLIQDECDAGLWDCQVKCGLGEEGESCAMIKRCVQNEILGETIKKDKTLEVALDSDTRSIKVDWENAPAVSAMFVYKQGGKYKNERKAVCLNNNNCYSGFENYETLSDGWGNLDGGSKEPVAFRIRAIGGDAHNVSVTGEGLPPQVEEIRAQGFSEDVSQSGDKLYEDLSAPEVVTTIPINQQLPALFDYVLFVANDSVEKN